MNPQIGQTVNLPGGIPSGVAPGGAEYKTGAGPTKIKGTRVVNGRTYYDIDQTALGGGTGWIEASALGGVAPQAAPAAAPMPTSASVATPQAAPAPPVFDLVAATNAAYNTPEIQAANKAITERQAALAKASGEINDNPFYSEATRVGKQAMLTEQANKDIRVQQDQLALIKADAKIKLDAQTGQYNINRQAYQDSLDQFNTFLNAGAFNSASGEDIANFAVQTGIPTSMIQSAIDTQLQKNVKTEIKYIDDGTNINAVLLDQKTGKPLSSEVIGRSEPSKARAATADEKTATGNFTNAQKSRAIKILAEADIMTAGTSDKLLSAEEQNQALLKIQSEIVPDPALAEQLLMQAAEQGGFSDWRP